MNYQFENDEDTIREKRKGQCPGDSWIKLWINSHCRCGWCMWYSCTGIHERVRVYIMLKSPTAIQQEQEKEAREEEKEEKKETKKNKEGRKRRRSTLQSDDQKG